MIVNKNVNFCPCCGSKLVEETDEIREEIRQIEETAPAYHDTYGGPCAENHEMKSETIAQIAYLWIPGIVFALFKRDLDDSLVKFHINQSIVINVVTMILLMLPLPQKLFNILLYLYLGVVIYGCYRAKHKQEQGFPYISRIKLVK